MHEGIGALRAPGQLCAAAFAALMLAGCATGPDANPKRPARTPEPGRAGRSTSRWTKYALKPVATVYADYVPSPVRTAVGNFFSNMSDVYSAANNLLQGEAIARGGKTPCGWPSTACSALAG